MINPEKPFKGSFNIRIGEELHEKATLVALDQNMKLNEFVKTALAFSLQRPEEVNRLIDNDNQIIQAV